MWIWYEETADGPVIRRLHGDNPEVVVPEKINGEPVVGLGAYAFSEKKVATDGMRLAASEPPADEGSGAELSMGTEDVDIENDDFNRLLEEGTICELAGDFIEKVSLPDSLKSIGELCFYQCRNLREISFGGGPIEIGSDAFMNCRKLSALRIRVRADEPTALRSILNQRTQETDVWFSDAVVHFPEYQEKYDLIGPAHIFELNIEGEGFRARKCFDGDRFSLTMYDEVFRHAMEKEDERTLCRMAALRLSRTEMNELGEMPEDRIISRETVEQGFTPMDENALKPEDRERYQSYLLEHMEAFCEDLIRRRDLSVWEELSRQGILTAEHKTICLKKLTAARWIEGTRQVLGM